MAYDIATERIEMLTGPKAGEVFLQVYHVPPRVWYQPQTMIGTEHESAHWGGRYRVLDVTSHHFPSHPDDGDTE